MKKQAEENLAPEVDQISITLINRIWLSHEQIVTQKCLAIILRICAHKREEMVIADPHITIAHDMRSIIQAYICSPLFHL